MSDMPLMELALCEVHSLVLRVGQPYVFRPVGDCEKCAAMVAEARAGYGESLGAPTENYADTYNMGREEGAREGAAQERERIKAALLRRHAESGHRHNYFACLARELEEGLL